MLAAIITTLITIYSGSLCQLQTLCEFQVARQLAVSQALSSLCLDNSAADVRCHCPSLAARGPNDSFLSCLLPVDCHDAHSGRSF